MALAFALILMESGGAAAPIRTPVTATPEVASEATLSALSPIDRTRAKLWALSPVEWQRYESLMTGIRGSISPANISPIEVLGIHARDAAERQKYAVRWVQMMYEDVERILAFQRAYDEAGRRLYPNEPLIAEATSPASTAADSSLADRDRLLLFTAPDCKACDVVVPDVLRQVGRVAGIDIYLSQVKLSDATSVRTWAARHGIPTDWVKSGQVTLNFEGGTLARLGRGTATLPVVMRRRGDAVTPLSTTALR